MTSTYDGSAWQLMQEAVEQLPETFPATAIYAWFEEKHPRTKRLAVQLQLRGMCVNTPPDSHNGKWPPERLTLYKIDSKQYARYRPQVHGRFQNGEQVGPGQAETGSEAGEAAQQPQFALETHLEEFMEANWESIDFGAPLQIWTDGGGKSGRQYRTDIGPIDFLCTDTASGDFVVIELKRDTSSDQAIGEVQRYMGWVQEHLAEGRRVRGVVVTHDYDDGMRYALKMAPNVEAWTYRVRFDLVRGESA